MHTSLSAEQIQELRTFDTCLVVDAIESFGVRLRNEGIATAGFRCLFKDFRPMVGYAATCRVRATDPPIVGTRYEERTDWWEHIASIPAPRILVMQDVDSPPGAGAYFGKVHAHILVALGCVGAITNGAARELPGIKASGLQVFAMRLATSRAYIHVVEFGKRVEVGHLTIQPGDLIHGDRHGITTVPLDIVAALPAAARVINEKKLALIGLTKKLGVTREELSQGLKDLHVFRPDSSGDGVKL